MSDEKLVTWVNGCLDKTVPDWTDSWSSGQLYIDLIANFRPDLTQVKIPKNISTKKRHNTIFTNLSDGLLIHKPLWLFLKRKTRLLQNLK